MQPRVVKERDLCNALGELESEPVLHVCRQTLPPSSPHQATLRSEGRVLSAFPRSASIIIIRAYSPHYIHQKPLQNGFYNSLNWRIATYYTIKLLKNISLLWNSVTFFCFIWYYCTFEICHQCWYNWTNAIHIDDE